MRKTKTAITKMKNQHHKGRSLVSIQSGHKRNDGMALSRDSV